MNTQEFLDLEIGKKILYIETLRKYQLRVERRTMTLWNKPRKKFTVSFKPYAAEIIVHFIYNGCHYYNDHTRNLSRDLNNQFSYYSHNADHYLKKKKKQLNLESSKQRNHDSLQVQS